MEFQLTVLPEGSAYRLEQRDPELEPGRIRESSSIRSFDCVEIDGVQ